MHIRRFIALLPLAWAAAAGIPALAQDIEDIPPELVNITPGEEDGQPATAVAAGNASFTADLGERPDLSPVVYNSDGDVGDDGDALQGAAADPGVAARAVRAASGDLMPEAAQVSGHTERVVFERRPVRVDLPMGRERLITLPSPAVLHVPSDIEVAVRLESIGRTVYATAIRPFAPIRIIAELLESGEQVPIDLSARQDGSGSGAEVEIIFGEQVRRQLADAASADTTAQDAQQQAAADMVQLTRHAARALYAPKRLAYGTPGVHQVKVDNTRPVTGLIRGVNVETTPLAQWKSGNLYVTAVMVRNRSPQPLEIPLEDVRGQWLAATAQHARICGSGSECDTTAIYLVCQRSFESCR